MQVYAASSKAKDVRLRVQQFNVDRGALQESALLLQRRQPVYLPEQPAAPKGSWAAFAPAEPVVAVQELEPEQAGLVLHQAASQPIWMD